MKKNLAEMSDYGLLVICQKEGKESESAKTQLYHKYKKYIWKYSHSFVRYTGGSIEIEDIIQEYTVLFLESIKKVRIEKLKESEYAFLVYLSYIFRAYKKVIKKKYIYEFNNRQAKFRSSHETNQWEDKEYFNEINAFYFIEDLDELVFIDSLEKHLTKNEHEMLMNYYKRGLSKTEIAQSLNISCSTVTYKFKEIFKKLYSILLPEKEYLMT